MSSTKVGKSKAKVASAPATDTSASAALDGNDKPKRKRSRSRKPRYELPEGADKLTCAVSSEFTLPEGFDTDKHAPLRPAHFASKADYYRYGAWRNRREAERCEALATEWQTRGPQLKAERKAKRMLSQFAKLRDEMQAAGMSVAEIDALLGGNE